MSLLVYSLVGCPYSLRCEQLVKDINHKLVKVKYADKEKYKKMNQWSSYPQVFFVDGNESSCSIQP